MKPTLVLLVILFGLMASQAIACGAKCVACGQSAVVSAKRVVVIQVQAKNLPHELARLATHSVKLTAHWTAQAPRLLGHQMQCGSDKVTVACHAATGQTQSTFQRITAEVTSLSLQLLRGASSYFLALLSGLLR